LKFRKKKQEPQIPKKIKPKRDFGVFVGLTKIEKRDLRQMSKKVGMTMAAFIRECIFKKFLDAIKIQIIGSGKTGIERIKREKAEDPLQQQMRAGFAEVVKEIKSGFKEQRSFLKPIPQKELSEIQERKIKRLKEVGLKTNKIKV